MDALGIVFRNMDASEALEARIREHVARLERLHGRIASGKVVVEAPHRRGRQGRLYRVKLRLATPRREVVVSHEGPMNHAHEDVYVALRDSFAAVRRRLEDHVRLRRGAVKLHALRAEGRVSRIYPLEGYGFIETPDGREVYFHRHALSPDDFRIIDLGMRVHFTEEAGDDGPQAAHVEVVHGAAAREARP